MDVEFKKLVEQARAKSSVDHSEGSSSQFDSGVRSLMVTATDCSDNTSSSLNVTKMINFKTARMDADSLVPNRKASSLQPLDGSNLGVGSRFVVTPNIGSFQPLKRVAGLDKIDLSMPTTMHQHQLATSLSKTKSPGLTLTGTGSMFLKSNIKKQPADDANVKGILRDSSLTEVRNKNIIDEAATLSSATSATAGLTGSIANEDRKSVRFNLERSVLPANNKEFDSDSSEHDDDEDEEEGDNWNFDEADSAYVKDITVMTKKPSLTQQLSLDSARNPNTQSRLSRMATLNRNLSTDSSPSMTSNYFERKIDLGTPSIRPLYEDSDSDSVVEVLKKITPVSDAQPLTAEQKGSVQMEQSELLEDDSNVGENIQLNNVQESNRNRLAILIDQEMKEFDKKYEFEMQRVRMENETRIKVDIEREHEHFNNTLAIEQDDLNAKHQLQLSVIAKTYKEIETNIEAENHFQLAQFQQKLKEEFELKRTEISKDHRAAMDLLQRNHTEILEDLERDLKTEEDLLRKEHNTALAQQRERLTHEMEQEKQRMRESGDYHMYEKLRCEKRLLEDKYKCLKEKYIRLKNDVKITLERRNHRRSGTGGGGITPTTTTNSETDRSLQCQKQFLKNTDIKNSSVSSDRGRPPAAPSTPQHLGTKVMVVDKFKEPKLQKDKHYGAAAKYVAHIQQHFDDTTSFSQSDTTMSHNNPKSLNIPATTNVVGTGSGGDNGNSDSEAFRGNQENNNNLRGARKKLFTRLKSASTSRLNTTQVAIPTAPEPISPRPCTPVENLRRQLQKLEDLEDQFPDNCLDTYHLRYPFKDTGGNSAGAIGGKDHSIGSSSELEFFKHRIHMERDSVRRAKESLRSQRGSFRIKHREMKQRQANNAIGTQNIAQILQDEKELAEMEVNLHRTRALLGEKVIRLRHLEQSLQRICEKIAMKPTRDTKLQIHKHTRVKDDATVSDISSHSSSGFSSTSGAGGAGGGGGTTTDTNDRIKRFELNFESATIIESLEHLNAEIRDIWEILSKQKSQGKSGKNH